jgi:hypothetical protein
VLLLLLMLAVPLLRAQSAGSSQSIQFPAAPVPLVEGWRTHAGDNLAWAQPGFDDSNWKSAALSDDTQLPAGIRWYRMRVHLPTGASPLALMVVAPGGSFDVWLDGRRLSNLAVDSWMRMTSLGEFVIPIAPSGNEMEIAVRVSFPAYVAVTYFSTMRVVLGGATAVQEEAGASTDQRVSSYLPSLLFNIALVVAGVGAFILFRFQRSRREYFWLGLYFVFLGANAGLWRAVDCGLLPFWVNSLLADPLTYLILVCQIEFSFAFINREVSRGWRTCEVLLLITMIPAYLACAGMFPTSAYWLIEAGLSFLVGFGLPVLLLVQFRKGNREAGLLILPSLLPAAAVALNDIGTAVQPFGFDRLANFLETIISVGRVQFSIGGFRGRVQINWIDIADIGFLLAIGAVLLFRFNRVSREQARGAAEFEAAQRVQSLLMRRVQSTSAGLRMEVVYRPAQEVGGDFFHTVQIGGSTRIVIGDVSGKGMGAAMLVSVLLGALDAIAESSPAAVLHELNGIMLARQKGGFATCLCAVVAPDGALTLANAGHLAPYLRGQEIPVESGLPLGIAPDVAYSETRIAVAPADQLTLLSDGVVEARNAAGELFGFDRTCGLSTSSAEEMVLAAQQHGQEDDITVLTLTFAPA